MKWILIFALLVPSSSWANSFILPCNQGEQSCLGELLEDHTTDNFPINNIIVHQNDEQYRIVIVSKMGEELTINGRGQDNNRFLTIIPDQVNNDTRIFGACEYHLVLRCLLVTEHLMVKINGR